MNEDLKVLQNCFNYEINANSIFSHALYKS